jgi:hypothetical protein
VKLGAVEVCAGCSMAFTVPHLGNFADDWRAQQRMGRVRYPNVFADTSGVRRFDYLAGRARLATIPVRTDIGD